MTIFERLYSHFRTTKGRLRRVKDAAHLLMSHVGLRGRCECLATQDDDGRPGMLLIIYTIQRVPSVDREQFGPYFRRKLFEFGELGSIPLMVVIRDANDLARAKLQHADVSSARIASVIAAANEEQVDYVPSLRLAAVRENMRARTADRRRQREEESSYAPLQAAPLTDLG